MQAAIIAAFDGMEGSQIGQTIYASSFYAAVAALGSWVKIVEITIGTSSLPVGFTASMDIDQIPTLEAANINVSVD